MNYIDKNLNHNEIILYRGHLSCMIFFPAAVFFLLSIMLTPLFWFAFAGFFFAEAITYLTAEFAVTNQRVIAKTGFFRRHSVEILLNRIEGVMVNQSLIGRICDYGTVLINGIGTTREAFFMIDRPLEMRQQILSSLAKSTTN